MSDVYPCKIALGVVRFLQIKMLFIQDAVLPPFIFASFVDEMQYSSCPIARWLFM